MSGKIVKIIGYVVLGITAIVGIVFFIYDAPDLNAKLAAMENLPQDMKILETEKAADNWSGLIMTYSYVLLIAAAVAAVGFAIFKFIANAFENPKSAIKPLIVLAGLVLIVVISYSLGLDSLQGLEHIKEPVTASTVKMVDASIYLMYIFLGLTVLSILYSSISRIWK
jgi:hypothetical protein